MALPSRVNFSRDISIRAKRGGGIAHVVGWRAYHYNEGQAHDNFNCVLGYIRMLLRLLRVAREMSPAHYFQPHHLLSLSLFLVQTLYVQQLNFSLNICVCVYSVRLSNNRREELKIHRYKCGVERAFYPCDGSYFFFVFLVFRFFFCFLASSTKKP